MSDPLQRGSNSDKNTVSTEFLSTKKHLTPKELSVSNKILLRILSFAIRIWNCTLRFEIDSGAPLETIKSHKKPFLILFWHNRLFLTIKFYRSFWKPRKTFGLTSVSKDGAWVAELLKILGVYAIRGSSSKRGHSATSEILNALNHEKGDIVITPDGPKGPVYSIKPTILHLAEKTGVDLLLVGAHYTNAWRLKNWDRFFIPKPFSKVILRSYWYKNFDELVDKAKELGMTAEELIKLHLSGGSQE